MADKKHILVVDDDPPIREVIRFALTQAGMIVTESADGRSGLERVSQIQPDLIVLDILMPEMDGLTMCRELRKTSNTPIIFLSSKDDEIDRIVGLEIGGDDYLSKPFSPRELVARVNVILKRLATPPSNSSKAPIRQHGALQLCPESYAVHWQNHPIVLTVTEFHLLYTLMRTPHKVFTRDELVQADFFKDIISDRTVDSHIRRLRQKFSVVGCETLVETMHGFGYKLGPCSDSVV